MSCYAIYWHGVMLMLLTVIPALLSLCALALVLWGIGESVLSKAPQPMYHIIPLRGDGGKAEQTVRWSLHNLRGRLYFVDCGLDPDGQMTVELLLRCSDVAILCAREQIIEELRGNIDLGARTD